jgi:hypothetical protein
MKVTGIETLHCVLARVGERQKKRRIAGPTKGAIITGE